MKNLILTLSLMMCGIFAFAADEVTDITSQYITNPSFETVPSNLTEDATRCTPEGGSYTGGAYTITSLTGWSLTTPSVCDLMTSACKRTDDNYGAPGTPSDGTYMLYMRNSWAVTSASVKQDITVPAGNYMLTVDYKCVSTGSHTVTLAAGSETAGLSFQSSMPSSWSTGEVYFSLDEETKVNIGVSIAFTNSAGGSVLLDNFRLYSVPEGYTPDESDVSSPTEGVITADFVQEDEMMTDLLQMIANFSEYMVNNFFYCVSTNSAGESCGYFYNEAESGANNSYSNEASVRVNADFSMLAAFLVKYGFDESGNALVTFPSGITQTKLAELAKYSLIYSYSTHKANKLKITTGSDYWGSVSASDYVWESSLWAMSVAYSAYFQWDELTATQQNYIYAMLKAECNYELNRTIPTAFSDDTKAEENGWEVDILAATLGLFPEDNLASQWYERMREFAINSYSHYSDAGNSTVIDDYNGKTVADLYEGNNLYTDYTLQNHYVFHTSYQNVVMQELGEAALALKMFQGNTETWKSNSLMHNNQEVMDSVLNWLALTDGELAMPNGNDWSLFLYDQLPSYSTQACFQRDANALMLENLAYKYIQARQTTTTDGSWLLRPDCGARRMGVEGHRVMMAYLMHMMMSTKDMTPPTFEEFRQAHSEAKVLECQNVVRAFTKDRFTCFSWNTGLPSYTGYFAPNSADNNKILVPYRANQSGNFLGWYTVNNKSTNVSPVVSGIYDLQGDAYTMNGEVKTNEETLDNRFAIYSTPGNAIIYLDCVTGLASGTITGEYGGLMAISTDDFTKLKRTLYYDEGNGIEHKQLDGASFTTFNTTWMNIDDQLGVVGQNGKSMAFGDRAENNSIMTSKLYPMYKSGSTSFANNGVIGRRHLVYYSNIDAETTAEMNDKLIVLTSSNGTASGWNAVIAPDPDGTYYLLISNFKGSSNSQTLTDLQVESKAPVFPEETTISSSKSTVTFELMQNHSAGRVIKVLVEGTDLVAKLRNDSSAYITASTAQTMKVYIGSASKEISIDADQTLYVTKDSQGNIIYEESEMRETAIDPTGYIVNPNFDEGTTGWSGSPTVDYSEAEKYNTTFDVYQKITGLEEGCYVLTCQGFYRAGGDGADVAAKSRTSGSEALNAKLYATNGQETTYSTSLMSIFEEADKVGNVGTKQSTYGYVPNTMEDAHFYFLAGLYQNSVEVEVGSDGELTIGVKAETTISADWTAFDTFTLTPCSSSVEWELGDEWGTLIVPFNMEIPEELEAWTCEGIAEENAQDVLDLKGIVRSIDIKANKPYIMSGTQGTYSFTGATVNTTDSLTDGWLTGTYNAITPPQDSYILQNHGDGPAFYMISSSDTITVGPYHCYLTLPETEGEAKAVVYFPGSVPSDKPTGIETVSEATANGKGAIYDLSGRRVHKAQKGVYIVDGKKVVM